MHATTGENTYLEQGGNNDDLVSTFLFRPRNCKSKRSLRLIQIFSHIAKTLKTEEPSLIIGYLPRYGYSTKKQISVNPDPSVLSVQ